MNRKLTENRIYISIQKIELELKWITDIASNVFVITRTSINLNLTIYSFTKLTIYSFIKLIHLKCPSESTDEFNCRFIIVYLALIQN